MKMIMMAAVPIPAAAKAVTVMKKVDSAAMTTAAIQARAVTMIMMITKRMITIHLVPQIQAAAVVVMIAVALQAGHNRVMKMAGSKAVVLHALITEMMKMIMMTAAQAPAVETGLPTVRSRAMMKAGSKAAVLHAQTIEMRKTKMIIMTDAVQTLAVAQTVHSHAMKKAALKAVMIIIQAAAAVAAMMKMMIMKNHQAVHHAHAVIIMMMRKVMAAVQTHAVVTVHLLQTAHQAHRALQAQGVQVPDHPVQVLRDAGVHHHHRLQAAEGLPAWDAVGMEIQQAMLKPAATAMIMIR